METQIVPLWQVLVGLGVLLAIAEIFVPGFILFPIGVAVALTGVVAMVTDHVAVLFTSFAVIAGILFGLSNKYLKRHKDEGYKTNVDGLVGQEGLVDVEIDNQKNQGYIKIFGDQWRALSIHDKVLATGTRVVVEKVDGNKVWVIPKDR